MGNTSSSSGSAINNPNASSLSDSMIESSMTHQSIRDISTGKTRTVSDKQPDSAKFISATSTLASNEIISKKPPKSLNNDAKLISEIPGQPLNLAKLFLGSHNTTKKTAVQPTLTGGFDMTDTEIEINIVPLTTFGHSFKGGAENFNGGAEMSESAIDIEIIDHNLEQAGGANTGSDFDANKLLQSIMQMGGANSDTESSIETSVTSSSYDAKPIKNDKKSNKNKSKSKDRAAWSDSFDDSDDSSSSSDDSNTFSTDSVMEFNTDSEPVDFEYIKKQNKKNLKKANKYKFGSDMVSDEEVYVLTDSSDKIGGVTLRSFADPLRNGSRSIKSKKSKGFDNSSSHAKLTKPNRSKTGKIIG